MWLPLCFKRRVMVPVTGRWTKGIVNGGRLSIAGLATTIPHY